MKWSIIPVLAIIWFAPTAALADDTPEIVPEDLRDKAISGQEKKDGWEGRLNLGFTFSFGHSNNVVGQTDGVTLSLGLLIDSGWAYYAGQHAWENELKINEQLTKTPQLDSFTKSQDSLNLLSLYTFSFNDPEWMGLYVKFKLETAIFPGEEVRPDATTYRRTFLDGTTDDVAKGPQESLDLTDGFETLRMVESTGVFADPVKKDEFTLKTKLGFGAQQIIARDGFAIADDDATADVVEVKQLDTSNEIGFELEIAMNGKVDEKTVTWNAKANFFQPVYSSSDEFSGLDAMSIELNAGLSIKLAEWASLDYVLSAKRIPLILDDWQVQNGLVLTTGFNLL